MLSNHPRGVFNFIVIFMFFFVSFVSFVCFVVQLRN